MMASVRLSKDLKRMTVTLLLVSLLLVSLRSVITIRYFVPLLTRRAALVSVTLVLHSSMKEISLAQVPSYLQEGEYFKSLSEGEDDTFSVPSGVLKADFSIANPADLRHLLLSMQFWIADTVQCKEAVLSYMTYLLSAGLNDETDAVIREFEPAFPFLTVARIVLSMADEKPSVENFSAMPLVQYVLTNHPASLVILMHLCNCEVAGAAHPLDQNERDTLVRAFVNSHTVDKVAESGDLEMLKLLYSHNIRSLGASYYATKGGHLACLQLLTSQGDGLTEQVSLAAAVRGHVNILQHIHTHDPKAVSHHCSYQAAESGHLACLQFLHSTNCPKLTAVASGAAMGGHLYCLQFAHENGFPWDAQTCANAARGEHFACLVYAHSHGCAWDENTTYYAAMTGNLQCLVYAHIHGCAWNEHTCAGAAGNNRLNTLQYAHQQGCPWDAHTSARAAMDGHITCLQYAHDHGCAWDEETCAYAASGGHLTVLQYVRERGCPWDAATCFRAAMKGQLECLTYAHENNCPWDGRTTQCALTHFACLEYAVLHNCPCAPNLAEEAFSKGLDDSGFFLLQHCPTVDNSIFLFAVRADRLDILQACVEAEVPWHEDTLDVAEGGECPNCKEFVLSHYIAAAEDGK